MQSEIKNSMQSRIIRDAEIIEDRKLSADERQRILEDPSQVQQYYQNKLVGPGHVRLQNQVRDIEERTKDIIKLEKVRVML